MPIFTDQQLNNLRREISALLSEKRFAHVLAVEEMANRLAVLFFNDAEDLSVVAAAALLHDNTKELSFGEQVALLEKYRVEVLAEDLASPPTLHAITGALVIPEKFPEFADDRIISAVKHHTTGREDMTLYEKIIFLADYIDETRDYPDCRAVRSLFWDSDPASMNTPERLRLLDTAILSAIDRTLAHLEKEGRAIHPATLMARNQLRDGEVGI